MKRVSWNIKTPGTSIAEADAVTDEKVEKEIDEYLENDKSKDKDKEVKKENLKKTIAKKNNSEVTFNEISDGVDLQYLLSGKSLKENIIINKKITSNKFKFNISVKNLIPEVKANKIIFLDEKTKKEIFNMMAPVMYDAIGEISDDIKIDINKTGNNYTLTVFPNEEWINNDKRKIDKDGTDLYFLSSGYLHKIIDKNGNTAVVWYNGIVLNRVIDGAGRETKFESTKEGYLLTITDPAGRKTNFRYDGIKLSNITYPDGKVTKYYYDSNNNITNAVNYDGTKINYEYYGASPYRVKKVKELAGDGTSAGELNINYSYNETRFTDQKGRTESYQFNNAGNTICVTDSNGNAEAYKYLEDNKKSKNKLELTSKLQKSTKSYIRNHSAEKPSDDWSLGSWGELKGTGSFSNEAAYSGYGSLKLNKPSYETRIFYGQSNNLIKGKTYTFSSYIKTENITTESKKGATLIAHYKDNKGAWQTVEGSYVSGTTDWERHALTFTLPEDSASTQVIVRVGIVEGSKGTAYFDAIQLEEGSLESRYNLLENSDFDYGFLSSGNWEPSEGVARKVELLEDRSSYIIKGDGGKNKYIRQSVNVSGKKGDSFILSGWAKAEALPKKDLPNRAFALDVGIILNDGTVQWEIVHFNYDTANWQFTSGRVVTKGDYKSITFYALYYDQENTVAFDNVQMYKEEFGQSYQYDSKGNVISTADLAKQQSKFEYNGNNDLIKSTDPKGNQFKYEYDGKRNITKATSAMNVVYNFQYDSYGNPIKTTIGGANFISSTASYTPDGNHVSSVTDSLGNTVSYNYDSKTDNLINSTDPKGNVTTNSYDVNDRLTSVTKKVEGKDITNTYGYNNDRIDTIGHNGFNYKFLYDSLGNNIGVNVGNQKLITNTYEKNGGNLLESTYGNGAKVQFEYDNIDRIIAKKVNGVEIVHYSYGYSGNLGILEDKVNNITYRYTYDLADRLVKITDSRGNTYKNGYDANNNINKEINIINGKTLETGYEFDKDNKITKLLLNDKDKFIGYNYDELARLTDKTLSLGNSKTFKTSFDYIKGINGSTSTMVGSINNNGNVINYTYDKNGNIETIKQGDKLLQKYYYNELNELIREDNKDLNKTIKYNYDAGGNIVSKAEYGYTEANALGSATSTINYNYEDSNWKDKLTSYNGKSITYDAIGNPLTYDGDTYIWERGRTLAEIRGKDNDISYKYNESGIRTEKNVNGVVSKYTLHGDKVVYEEITNGNNVDKIYYTYDSRNDLVSINLNGAEYYYVRNAQGDIIALIDKDGTEVVSYKYDSWGKLISIDGSLKDTVGEKNPYRYRGYRYDTETGLYYLQSRYYNPECGRFINGDSEGGKVGQLLSHNVFAYCDNNPIVREDSSGKAWWIIGAVVGAVAGGVAGAAYSYYKTGSVDWRYVAGGAAAGALIGAGVGYLAEAAYGAIVGSLATAGTVATAASQRMENARRLGQEGERAARIIKNTQRIPSITKTAKYRIPDALDKSNKVLVEIKNVKYQRLTNQIKDFSLWADQKGYDFILRTRPDTRISGHLQEYIDSGKIIHLFIGD